MTEIRGVKNPIINNRGSDKVVVHRSHINTLFMEDFIMPIGVSVSGSTCSILSPSNLPSTKQSISVGKKCFSGVALSERKSIAGKSKLSDSTTKNKPLAKMTITPVKVKSYLSLTNNKKSSSRQRKNITTGNQSPTAVKRTKIARKSSAKLTKKEYGQKTSRTLYNQKVKTQKRDGIHLPIDAQKLSSIKQNPQHHNALNTSIESLVEVKERPFPKDQFVVWNQAINTMQQEPQKAVGYLFGEAYCAETANSKFDELIKDQKSNLSIFMNRMESTWKRTATPEHMDALRSNMEDKLKFAWQRMAMGDTYKLQMVVESLCLQPGGGHHRSPEMKQFIQNMEKTITDFRDGRIYDGTNAINADNPRGEVTRSYKKVLAVESTYNGVNGNEIKTELKGSGGEPGTIRNTSSTPDISLSNLGDDSGVHVELVINNADGKRLKDSVAFSDGTYSFHGASVEMEVRDQKIASQLDSGEFAGRISAYVTHNLNNGRSHEDLVIAGDANLCLFDDDHTTGERTLKPGVQEILDNHHLALVVPSGKVTWGRPISDQLHKNAKSTELDGFRDTMLLMVPVTEGNLETIKQLGDNQDLRQDTFFPTTMVGGKSTDTASIIHHLESDRKQFSLSFSDRVMTDHAILTGPNHIIGNTADCKGVGTAGKNLTYDAATTVWGNNTPTVEQYYQMMLDSAKELASTFSLIERGIPLFQEYQPHLGNAD
ncbi:MAG: hypothetical protein QS748_07215 [Candidatus Endonucleobacter bathymodioli]|uniref:Uncharacterized protein n=1 Tax=Candidatus Endonucleibacter bathymodioli TaxID=539814 RepID=A0AA90NVI7_9GAMM|nr:hypothetical protein [Candidatus Endonucleobacter bathymodioli]